MPHRKKTAGIILAAGMSQRFGQPKQLLKLENKHLLEYVLNVALASRLAKVVLVLGHEHEKIYCIRWESKPTCRACKS